MESRIDRDCRHRSGATLTLTHEMDPQRAAYEDRTREGWTMILNTLAPIMEKNDD